MKTVEQLKSIARRHYEAYHAEVDGMGCGAALAQHIKPAAAIHAREFNLAMDALAALDPACPKKRLPESVR